MTEDNNPQFMNKTTIERENLLMPEILRCLINLGGKATRNQVINELRETSEIIPEEYIDFERKSHKTGNNYRPFRYQFNFAIKHLSYADYLTIPVRGSVKLTEKGRNADLDNFDGDKLVRTLSQPIMDEKSQKHLVSIEDPQNNVEIEEVSEEDHEDRWQEDLANALKEMSPKKFELFARSLVNAMGVNIDEKKGIQYIADGGIDGFGYITSDDFRTTRVAIQAKHWEGKVSSPEIDKFRGAMDKYNAEFGIFITTSSFTRDAIEASRTGTRVITLIDGDRIAELVAQHELYVTPTTTYLLDDFYFEKD